MKLDDIRAVRAIDDSLNYMQQRYMKQAEDKKVYRYEEMLNAI